EVRESVNVSGFAGAGFLHTNSAVVDLHNMRLYLRPPGTGRSVKLGPALTAIGLAEAPITGREHGQFYVDVEINGARGKMIIDTGAGLTHVDNRFAAQMKTRGFDTGIQIMDAAGVMSDTELAKVRSFKIGGVPARASNLLLGHISYYGSSGGKVIGILGMDLLGQNWSIIDLGQQKLYFSPAR
ncbi:MAG TPA: retropepsin-like aspartic protease, partial [Pyrinomonadaceae bacterium]|nr:retropepsin-like aspartic protease [Pyrinomonadaceae bacterium]